METHMYVNIYEQRRPVPRTSRKYAETCCLPSAQIESKQVDHNNF